MTFLARRLAFYFAAFFVAITLNFFIPRWMPGDPATRILLALRGKLNAEQIEVIRASLWLQGLAARSSTAPICGGCCISISASRRSISPSRPPTSCSTPPAGRCFSSASPPSSRSASASSWASIRRGTAAAFSTRFFTPINVMLNAFTPAVVALLLWYALSLEWTVFPLGRAHDINLVARLESCDRAVSVALHAALPVALHRHRQFRRLAPRHAQHHDQPAQRGFRHAGRAPRASPTAASATATSRATRSCRRSPRWRCRSATCSAAPSLPRWCSTIPASANSPSTPSRRRDYSFIQAQLLLLTLQRAGRQPRLRRAQRHSRSAAADREGMSPMAELDRRPPSRPSDRAADRAPAPAAPTPARD